MGLFELHALDALDLTIHDQPVRFRANQHPVIPGLAHAMEGRKSVVYRLTAEARTEYALKVMKGRHRTPAISRTCDALDRLKGVPGLSVCERRCLTQTNSAGSLVDYPDLQYGILMPFVKGQSWFDFLYLGKKRLLLLTKSDCLTLAGHLAEMLARLESLQVAHCDISPGNVLVDPSLRVELVDLEEIYGPGMPRPAELPLGTPGYQHEASRRSAKWAPDADRFAGAILLAEMMAWHDEAVRSAAFGDSYFDQAELQSSWSGRYDVLKQSLKGHHLGADLLLAKAWASRSLSECPTFAEWAAALRVDRYRKAGEVAIGAAFEPFWIAPGAARRPTTPAGPRSDKPPLVTWE